MRLRWRCLSTCAAARRVGALRPPYEAGTGTAEAGGTPAVPVALSLPRPRHALVTERHRADALVVELLHALTFVGLGRVEVPLRIRSDAVHAVELARLPPAVAERSDFLKRLANDDAHPLVLAVGQHDEALLRVLGEHDVPHRAGAPGVLGVEMLFHECTVGPEHLQAIVLAVAD